MATPIEVTLVAAPIVRFLVDKLTSKTWKELKYIWSIDTSRLESRLATIMDVLKEAEARSVPTKTSMALQRWLNKLKDAAYDADDVVHECHAESLRQKVESKLTDFLSANSNFAFSRRMNKKVKDVMKILDEIMEDRQWLLLRDESAGRSEMLDFGRETSSVLIESLIYGRDGDKEKIVSYLINEENDKEVSVLPIVGLGGVGKTTLAQLIYVEENIDRRFNQKLWVWVSDKFSVEGILRKIIEQLTKNVCNLSQIESMQQILKVLLTGKRFLLVLDDVWSLDEQRWWQLLTYLRAGKKGCKILVTTRCLSVANMMCSTFAYPLKGLSDNDCWEIFNNRAFGNDWTEKSARLEEIGKKVVKKCGGLPLAAEALGSLMRTKRGEIEWSIVQQTKLWRLPEDRTKILSALKLSYQLMPSHLKQCFAYFSLFPKEYKIYKEKLISLWVVEGFIPTLVMDTQEENIDKSCIDRLLEIYFLQDAVDYNHHDRVVAYKMHDVVQDLAWSVAGDEFLFVDGDTLCFKKSYSNSSYRYLSLLHDNLSFDTLNASCEMKKVRSLISLSQEGNARCNLKESSWELLMRLSLLRVLDLSSADISELPHTVSNLKQLRLLNLSNTKIRMLPSTIIGLHYLFTLNLSNCEQLQELPSGISNMSNLRLLDIYGCDSLTRMPARIGRLTQLHSLTMFIVGETDGHTIKELRNMNLIRGRLQIKDLHKLKDRGEAEAADLQEKKNLRQLELFWKGDCETIDDVFEGLQPCGYLDHLMISGYRGTTFPSWMSAGLHSLGELSIISCKFSSLSSWSMNGLHHLSVLKKLKISSCEELTHLPENIVKQRFSSLRTLDISDNKNLISLCEGEGTDVPILFTSLHCLILRKCESLNELPGWFDGLTALQSLDLSACNKLSRLQQLKSMNWISVTLSHNLAMKYGLEAGEDSHLAAVILDQEETQRGGEQETSSKTPRRGAASKFLKRISCVGGSKVHM